MRDPISRLSYLLGRLRGLFLPFGLFALVAVGLHVGADRIDDRAFAMLSASDAAFDALASWLIRAVGGLLGLGPAALDEAALSVASWVDVELKEHAARVIALALELAADVLIALPVFLHDQERTALGALAGLAKRTFTDPTLLRVTAPVAAGAAATAGAFAIARELQVLAHDAALGLGAALASRAATATGAAALGLVTWRLGLVAITGAAAHADARAERAPRGAWRRRLGGLYTALVALPLALAALDATPVAGTLRALFLEVP